MKERLDVLHAFFDKFIAQNPKAKKQVGLHKFQVINNIIMVFINVNPKEHFKNIATNL